MDKAERIEAAKAKAETYHAEDRTTAEAGRRAEPQELSEWTDIVGQRIEQAIREGAFDNLPGRGRPLNLDKDPFVPDDQQMAFKLLQNNDLKPAWISERNQVLAAIDQLRQDLSHDARRVHEESDRAVDAMAEERLAQNWSDLVARWAKEIAALNKRIATLNLQQPIARLEIAKLRLDDELAKAGVRRPL